MPSIGLARPRGVMKPIRSSRPLSGENQANPITTASIEGARSGRTQSASSEPISTFGRRSQCPRVEADQLTASRKSNSNLSHSPRPRRGGMVPIDSSIDEPDPDKIVPASGLPNPDPSETRRFLAGRGLRYCQTRALPDGWIEDRGCGVPQTPATQNSRSQTNRGLVDFPRDPRE